MTPDEIQVGQVLQGKGADADKQRLVTAIDAKRREAVTTVYRNGTLIAEGSVIGLHTLARWADRDITPAKETN
jgi:sensor c-di-GMP phosphodiesterase-like protein